MSLREKQASRTCECGYPVQSFTFGVLHRVWAHRDSPADARGWAIEIMAKETMPGSVIPLPRQHDQD